KRRPQLCGRYYFRGEVFFQGRAHFAWLFRKNGPFLTWRFCGSPLLEAPTAVHNFLAGTFFEGRYFFRGGHILRSIFEKAVHF
ncbi:MAG: hypothetical protein LBP95_11965, partial [Deltaproteobacteria bacterium]|nr:hypothetical protein [Deltaproteobacteria bacterium]